MIQLSDSLVGFEEEGKLVASVMPAALPQVRSLRPDVAQILPCKDGWTMVELPWTDDACRVLQNLGVNTAAASEFMRSETPLVEGKYKPLVHQRLTASYITLNPRCYVFNEPRTGKTGALILAIDWLQKNGGIVGGCCIITTQTTMDSVWVQAIRGTLPQVKVIMVHGPKKQQLITVPADFYVTNYDSVRLISQDFIKAKKEGRIGCVVIDELTHVGNPRSQRSKAIFSLCNHKPAIPRVIGMTGTPGNDPETVWGMTQVVNPAAMPFWRKGSWMEAVAYRYGLEPFMWRLRADAPEMFKRVLSPAIRFAKKDVLDLPPVTVQQRFCKLSSEQERVRKDLVSEAIALMESGEEIRATNGGVLFQKLMQVAQGFCYGPNGEIFDLPHADRTKVLLEAIGETDRKVVVLCCYRYAIEVIAKEVEQAGYSCRILHGGTSEKDKTEILHAFQNAEDPRVLVSHIMPIAYGVELSAADTLIFASPPPLGDFMYAQAVERLSSAKQTAARINIIRIAGSQEERKFYTRLDEGFSSGQQIAALFEDFQKNS